MYEKAFWAREVAETLNISESTLRKYCLILEKAGYRFLRGDNNRRAFRKKDLEVLRQFKSLADQGKNHGKKLDEAAVTLVDTLNQQEERTAVSAVALVDTNKSIPIEKIREVIQPILAQNEMLKKELTELKERLAKVDEKTDALLARSEHQEKKWWRFWE
jgi:DNA-binding transcriptional MerR regulator